MNDGNDISGAVEEPLLEVRHYRSIGDALGSMSPREWVNSIVTGLRAPKDSGAYVFARQQMRHLWSPLAGVVLPGVMVITLALMPTHELAVTDAMEVTMVDKADEVKLDDVKPLEQKLPDVTPPPPPEEMPTVTDNPVPGVANPTVIGVGQSAMAFSPQPAAMDSVAMIRSPVIMKGIYGSRNPGARGQALKQYGGAIGSSGLTEGAVLRALRWLKKFQDADGCWSATSGMAEGAPAGAGGKGGAAPAAMTGFALLTYLAHGETPGSEEFGPTVEKAIRWLIANQGGDGGWQRPYQHQIATYAMAEAYALTKIPAVKESAEKGLAMVIRGQNVMGGWNYPLLPTDQRSDTSVMAWCAQALKAGKMAGLENPGLDECIKKAIEGFKRQADPNGGFCYATMLQQAGPPQATRLTGAGALSMQFLGASKLKETRAGIQWLQEHAMAYEWARASWNRIYCWYYDTQARFHEGGDTWTQWNKIFAPELVNNQTILKGQGVDGKDIGFWKCGGPTADVKGGGNAHGYVINTTLCALQLQVYYRYLPTYKTPAAEPAPEATAKKEDTGDIEVQVK